MELKLSWMMEKLDEFKILFDTQKQTRVKRILGFTWAEKQVSRPIVFSHSII
jgi:hypothetical protein